jgi:hypothetical protein
MVDTTFRGDNRKIVATDVPVNRIALLRSCNRRCGQAESEGPRFALAAHGKIGSFVGSTDNAGPSLREGQMGEIMGGRLPKLVSGALLALAEFAILLLLAASPARAVLPGI